MKRRRALLALSSTVASIAGCAESDEPGSREPFDPPADTVPPNDGSNTDLDRDGDVDPVPSELSVRSRLADLPSPTFDDGPTVSYHAIGTDGGTGLAQELYLAPLTERAPPAAGDHLFLAFNRGTRTVTFAYDRFSVLRLESDGWVPLERDRGLPLPQQTVIPSYRQPGIFLLNFQWFRDSGRLEPGTYAFVVPTRIHESSDPNPRLVAPFVVEPEAELCESGDRTASLRIVNDGPKYGDPAVVSAELLRAETADHPARVRLRVRPFERIGVRPPSVSEKPIGRATSDERDGDDAPDRLVLTTDAAFRGGCWVDEAPDSTTTTEFVDAYHGDELRTDLELATGLGEECARADRYRFGNVFRTADSRIDGGFEIRLDRE